MRANPNTPFAKPKEPGKWKGRGGLSTTSRWVDRDKIIERFMQNVYADPNCGCWLWGGCLDQNGYGLFGLRIASIRRAHRASYFLFKGKLPANRCVDHRCKMPACVNPEHLRLVTFAHNKEMGDSPCAVNARKTHCVNGHAFDAKNTYKNKTGGRQCKTCRLLSLRRHHARIRALRKKGK